MIWSFIRLVKQIIAIPQLFQYHLICAFDKDDIKFYRKFLSHLDIGEFLVIKELHRRPNHLGLYLIGTTQTQAKVFKARFWDIVKKEEEEFRKDAPRPMEVFYLESKYKTPSIPRAWIKDHFWDGKPNRGLVS